MQPEQVWQAALGQLQLEMPKTTFDTWVRGTSLLTHEDDAYVVSVNNAYAKDWLENRLRGTVRRTLSGIIGRSADVRFVVAGNGSGKNGAYDPSPESSGEPAPETAAPPAPAPASTLNPKYK